MFLIVESVYYVINVWVLLNLYRWKGVKLISSLTSPQKHLQIYLLAH